MKKLVIFVAAFAMFLSVGTAFAKKPAWNGIVHAPFKTAQPKDWSAPVCASN